MSSATRQIPSIEQVLEQLEGFRKPIVELRAREAIAAQWPEVERWIFKSREQYQGSIPQSDYGLISHTEEFAWSRVTNCVVPREANASGLVEPVYFTAKSVADTRFSGLRIRFQELLEPDYLESAQATAVALVEIKRRFDLMHEDHTAGGALYQGAGRYDVRPQTFAQIEELFETWSGGADNQAAWDAFGNAKDVASGQGRLLIDLTEVLAAEAALQVSIRISVGRALAELGNLLEEELSDSDPFLLAGFTWLGELFSPIGTAMTFLETVALGFDDEGSSWLDGFEEHLKVSIEGSLTPDSAEAILSGLESIIAAAEETLEGGHQSMTDKLAEVQQYLPDQLVQGER